MRGIIFTIVALFAGGLALAVLDWDAFTWVFMAAALVAPVAGVIVVLLVIGRVWRLIERSAPGRRDLSIRRD